MIVIVYRRGGSPDSTQGVALLRRVLGGGDLESSLLDPLESLSLRLRRGGDLEMGLRGAERDLEREGEGERGLAPAGAGLRYTPGGGDLDLIRVSTGVRDLARPGGGGGDLESEYRLRGTGDGEYRPRRGFGEGERKSSLAARRGGDLDLESE